ncbi:hypothetical protein LMG18101_00492 [Ralstonia flaminis]|jgi:hypothetical protein|uniref:Uncharacterized protein n=1 Tax=Ralstonia flaminis TaxID=3058597 RepID=A0ABM9K070_9RALS|nr:hypothetical protein LMG18101_00492 [Ralstonia sp. LMG 18101]
MKYWRRLSTILHVQSNECLIVDGGRSIDQHALLNQSCRVPGQVFKGSYSWNSFPRLRIWGEWFVVCSLELEY